MSNALITAVHSMQQDLRYMETLSQNMVNIATPGYKRAIPSAPAFGEALRSAAQDEVAAGAPLPAPATSVLDLSAGAVKHTGRPLDLAISGEGFFELATAHGPAYTRAGDFRLDARGRLVSQNGDALQGMQGELVTHGGALSVDAAGRLLQDGAVVGQIKVLRFGERAALVKNAAGLLQPRAGQLPTLETRPQLQAGYLESSNVAPMREMMAMMETTRHFEAAQKLFQGYDEVIGNAIAKLGQF